MKSSVTINKRDVIAVLPLPSAAACLAVLKSRVVYLSDKHASLVLCADGCASYVSNLSSLAVMKRLNNNLFLNL